MCRALITPLTFLLIYSTVLSPHAMFCTPPWSVPLHYPILPQNIAHNAPITNSAQQPCTITYDDSISHTNHAYHCCATRSYSSLLTLKQSHRNSTTPVVWCALNGFTSKYQTMRFRSTMGIKRSTNACVVVVEKVHR